MSFDPIKPESADSRTQRVVWTTASIEAALDGMNKGQQLIAKPFYDNETKLLKADLLYQRTPEEVEHFRKCVNDILVFTKECQLMTPEGIQKVELRDYQEEYLRHLEQNRLSIFLSCRQSGKCFTFNTLHKVLLTSKELQTRFKIYNKGNYYELPSYEIYNIYGDYKIKPKNTSEKIVESFKVNDIKILTDTGFKLISHIHKTKPFNIYILKTSNYELECADEHIVFNSDLQEVFVKDLKPGDYILTESGEERVESIAITNTSICMCDMTVDDENHRLYTNGILSHNTTTSALYMLHYACTNTDKNCLVLGNKLKTAKEILDKIKNIFLYLPYYLKPGIKKWNETEIVFDNGCRIMAEATTINSGISFTYHCVLSDEFAHIQPNIINKFYSNIFPTITAGRARFIISSTQNGFNLFCKLYKAAESGESEYVPFKVDWYQVPEWNPNTKRWEKRDERWKNQQIANLGGESEFQMQFGTNFEISGNTLISSNKLKKIQSESLNFKEIDMYDGEYWKFHPDLDYIQDLRDKYLIITVDIAEGGGGDSSVIAVHELKYNSRLEFSYCELIGIMESNLISVEQLAEKTVNFISNYCETSGKTLLSFEQNTYGKLYMKSIDNIVYSNESISNWDQNIHVIYDKKYGWKVTSQSKKDACKMYKYLTESNKIINNYCKHTSQLECFIDSNDNGSYEASYGHDDLVMTSVQLSQVLQTKQYEIFLSEFMSEVEEIKTNKLDMSDLTVYDMLNYNPYLVIKSQEDVNIWDCL